MLLVLEIVIGVVVFGATLFALTYSSAFVADVTGYFRLLFIQRPYQQVFRLVESTAACNSSRTGAGSPHSLPMANSRMLLFIIFGNSRFK